MTHRDSFSDLWYTLARLRQGVVRRIVTHDTWAKRQDQFGATQQANAARGVVQAVAEYVAMAATANAAAEAAFGESRPAVVTAPGFAPRLRDPVLEAAARKNSRPLTRPPSKPRVARRRNGRDAR